MEKMWKTADISETKHIFYAVFALTVMAEIKGHFFPDRAFPAAHMLAILPWLQAYRPERHYR